MAQDKLLRCAECGGLFVWDGAEPAQLCPMCQRLAPPTGRRRGIVKWFSRSKGYGFITPTAGPELFVHKSGLALGQEPLRAGQLVEFGLMTTKRGVQAEGVVALETPDERRSG